MANQEIVSCSCSRVWNSGDSSALEDLVADDLPFQGSLGPAIVGRESFWQVVTSVRPALSDYPCAILACVSEGEQAFARLRFSGSDTGPFRNHPPLEFDVAWQDAKLFRFDGDRIRELWGLSDATALGAALAANAVSAAQDSPACVCY